MAKYKKGYLGGYLDNNMKIAFISSGNSIHVKKIANALADKGYNITLFTLPNHNKLADDFDSRIIIVNMPISGKKGYFLNSTWLKKKIIEGKYDLINSHYASGYGTLARIINVHPFVLTVLGTDVFIYPFKSKRNMHRIIKNFDAANILTSTSHVMKSKIEEFYKRNKKIYVTPFGVDLNIFYPRERRQRDVFCFGIIKKIEHGYGIDVLIKAFAKISSKYHNIRLHIFGRGKALDEYRKLAENLGVSEIVEFKGFVQNELVPTVLANIDAACFPSYSESFGVAAVEAMACGVPVIVSDADGFLEVVEREKTGFVVSKGNICELANAMERMYLLSPKDRIAMGKAGIEHVKKHYNFDENIRLYIQAIEHAVKNDH